MRPLRNKNPEIFRLITIRTQEARLWIRQNRDTTRLLAGILARYQELFEIQIYAYCILGNHLHMIIKAPKQNTDRFCENVNREIARRINWQNKRQGQFWSRRYDDQEIKSEKDLLEAFLYVNLNPTHHGLTQEAAKWPGLTSYNHAVNERDRNFSFFHYSAKGNQARMTTHKLRLSVLPQIEKIPKSKRASRIRNLLENRELEIIDARTKSGKGFLSARMVQEQDLGQIPMQVSNNPRPRCYTKSYTLKMEHVLMEKKRRKLYAIASRRFRLGILKVEFPDYSYKPPLHRTPKPTPQELTLIQGLNKGSH